MNFLVALYEEVIKNLKNDFSDNYDYTRFGEKPQIKQKLSLKQSIKNWFHKKDYRNILETPYYLKLCIPISQNFSFLYDKLENNESKQLLIKIVAYRLLGYKKVKLPLNTKTYWAKMDEFEKLADKSKFINPNFMHFMLYYFDLTQIGINIKAYLNTGSVLIDFFIKQYELNQSDKVIKAEEGDVVFDCGACWGDTALFFANNVGNSGKVYSFEFIPSNLNVFNINLNLNPELVNIVTIIEQPVFSEANIELYYKDNGPGSSVQSEYFVGSNGVVKTTTIDEVVEREHIKKVDFIKMDIEGSELSALKGATTTIQTFKPKLSIALYHDESDFLKIPHFIDSLGLGYKFYINHNTIHQEETVLFAEI